MSKWSSVRNLLLLVLAGLPLLGLGCAGKPDRDEPPAPTTTEELRQAIAGVLEDTSTPGAGVALVSRDRILWTAGIGLADRDAEREVTTDTLFRAGSISKTFVALAVLKLQEEGKLKLDDRLRDLVGDAEFTNPWEESEPVRLVHVLEHTAGFDDLALREYAARDPDISLSKALAFHPRSRTSRWRPGRYFSYSNGGPPLAAYAVERLSGKTFDRCAEEDWLRPLGMKTASFRLSDAVKKNIARSYQGDGRTEIPYAHILERPSGSLNCTPGELAHLAQFFLNRGTFRGVRMLRPESIERMETPTTTAAARAGLRAGYGLGNFTSTYKGFRFQGHNGGIDGFLSACAYSTDHGAGYVVMVNAGNGQAFNRIHDLVRAYLTRGWNKPQTATAAVSEERLQTIAGYYEPCTPRAEVLHFLERLVGVRRVRVEDGELRLEGLGEPAKPLLAVTDSLFRRPDDPLATVAFVEEEGAWTMQGMSNYRQVPAWLVWGQTAIVILCLLLMLSAVLFALVWVPRKLFGYLRGVGHLSVRILPLAAVLCLLAAFGLVVLAARNDPLGRMGNFTPWSLGFCLVTWLFALTTVAGLVQAFRARRWPMNRWVLGHAWLVSLANAIVLAYLAWWGIIGLRTWA
jgi:CubicO group peptidase (beta-lactamase class C family)